MTIKPRKTFKPSCFMVGIISRGQSLLIEFVKRNTKIDSYLSTQSIFSHIFGKQNKHKVFLRVFSESGNKKVENTKCGMNW